MYNVPTKVYSKSLNREGTVMRVRDTGHYQIDSGDGYYQLEGKTVRRYDSNLIVRSSWLPESDLTEIKR